MSADRFKIRVASLASVFPAVAGPAVGGYAGYNIGARFKHPELGALLGTLTMGTAGKVLAEKIQDANEAPAIPAGAPYVLDASSREIPAWALQGAQLMQPQLKQGSEEREPVSDVVMGEVPGFVPIRDAVSGGAKAGLRSFGGMALGGIPGGLIGTGVARGAERLFNHGRPVNVPGLNISLSDLLGSVGGAVGATKGYRYMHAK
jgi:outer membrane lipoprotein SlyB